MNITLKQLETYSLLQGRAVKFNLKPKYRRDNIIWIAQTLERR